MSRFVYLTKCPNCNKDLKLDDLDYRFRGCQDEYSYCTNCKKYYRTKVRYGKICKITVENLETEYIEEQ